MGELINQCNRNPRPVSLYYLLLAKTKKEPVWYVGITNNPVFTLKKHNVDLDDKGAYYYFISIASVIKETKSLMKQNEVFIFNDDDDLYSESDENLYIYMYRVINGKTIGHPGRDMLKEDHVNENHIDLIDMVQKDHDTVLTPGPAIISGKLAILLTTTPWDRMVHWFGRASDFPGQVNNLLMNKDEEQTCREISRNIEHQDGVFQATPYMVQVLIELLEEAQTSKAIILDLLYQVFKASSFMDILKPGQEEIPLSEDLWPEFESEDTDEMLWESFRAENYPYWQKHSLEHILKARSKIDFFAQSTDNKVKDTAQRLLEVMDVYLASQQE